MTREQLFAELTKDLPATEGKNIYIWGTGNTSALYQAGFRRLEKEGFEIKGYGDNNSAKWGETFHGKLVFSAEEIAKDENAVVFLCSPQKKVSDAVMPQLRGLGIECFILDKYIIKAHATEIMKVYDSLSDEKSKNYYAILIHNRMTNTPTGDDLYEGDQYFAIPAFQQRNINEVYVDCGAYVGDTFEQYLWNRRGMFSKIVAFEPDKYNYAAADIRRERLIREWNLSEEDIELYSYGIGGEEAVYTEKVYSNNHGLSSKVSGSSEDENEDCAEIVETRIITLDGFFKDRRFDFLKADIESYEYEMLIGAQNSIRANKPKIVVAIYHNAVDLYSIPLLLKELNPEYKLAVRQHSWEADDSVVYAWI